MRNVTTAAVLAWVSLRNHVSALKVRNMSQHGNGTMGDLDVEEDLLEEECAFEPLTQESDHLINPYGTAFPANWAPKFVCNVLTSLTTQVTKFNAFHKCGTKISVAGGKCLGKFFNRNHNKWAVQVRDHCGHGYNTSMNISRTKQVWWTRAPMDWMISNYKYHKRGDEKLSCWMNSLYKRFQDVLLMRPATPQPNKTRDQNYYSNYLRRISIEDGLFIEMFRVTHGNKVGTLYQLMVAAQEAKREDNMQVCLEDFMESPKKYNDTWAKVVRFAADGARMDKKLEECLFATSIMHESHNAHHSTYSSVSANETKHMRELIRMLDLRYFGGALTTASETVGCQVLPREDDDKGGH